METEDEEEEGLSSVQMLQETQSALLHEITAMQSATDALNVY